MHSEAICELSGCRLFYECLRLLHNTSSPFTPNARSGLDIICTMTETDIRIQVSDLVQQTFVSIFVSITRRPGLKAFWDIM